MNKCPITELEIESFVIPDDKNFYKLRFENRIIHILLDQYFYSFSENVNFLNQKHILAGAILNFQMFERKDINEFRILKDNWEDKIHKVIYPKTPKDKIENLFKSLWKLQKFDGEEIELSDSVSKPQFYYKHFFKSKLECFYYFKTLENLGLIRRRADTTGMPMMVQLTFKGLNYYLELTESGTFSNKCFVAMSFDKKMESTRIAIKTTLDNNHFDPIIIDEQLIDSSQTINDAIISELKSCKFCIADFTEQKDGVYFESGFAIGLGKPVIYTCHKDWFSKSHFDTNHFPHLIYESIDDLKDKLDKKIKAWIV